MSKKSVSRLSIANQIIGAVKQTEKTLKTVPKVIHKEPQKKKNLLKSSISELIQINIYKKGKEVEIVHKNVFTKKEIIISKLKIDEKEKKILLGSDFLNEEENRFTIVLKPIILNK